MSLLDKFASSVDLDSIRFHAFPSGKCFASKETQHTANMIYMLILLCFIDINAFALEH